MLLTHVAQRQSSHPNQRSTELCTSAIFSQDLELVEHVLYYLKYQKWNLLRVQQLVID